MRFANWVLQMNNQGLRGNDFDRRLRCPFCQPPAGGCLAARHLMQHHVHNSHLPTGFEQYVQCICVGQGDNAQLVHRGLRISLPERECQQVDVILVAQSMSGIKGQPLHLC